MRKIDFRLYLYNKKGISDFQAGREIYHKRGSCSDVKTPSF